MKGTFAHSFKLYFTDANLASGRSIPSRFSLKLKIQFQQAAQPPAHLHPSRRALPPSQAPHRPLQAHQPGPACHPLYLLAQPTLLPAIAPLLHTVLHPPLPAIATLQAPHPPLPVIATHQALHPPLSVTATPQALHPPLPAIATPQALRLPLPAIATLQAPRLPLPVIATLQAPRLPLPVIATPRALHLLLHLRAIRIRPASTQALTVTLTQADNIPTLVPLSRPRPTLLTTTHHRRPHPQRPAFTTMIHTTRRLHPLLRHRV
jgi:hypothetical protein